MSLQVKIRDKSRNPIFDPEKTTLYATGVRFATNAPGGFADCSFSLRRLDPFASWVIKESYQVQLFDGQKLVYEGDIRNIDLSSDGSVTMHCSGRQWLLGEIKLAKIWIDAAVASQFGKPVENAAPVDIAFEVQHGDTYVRASFAGVNTRNSETPYDADDYTYACVYDTRLPNSQIRRVEGTMEYRHDEGVRCRIYNVDQSAIEATISDASSPGGGSKSINTTFTHGNTRSVALIIGPSNDDAKYAQDDWMNIQAIVAKCHLHASHPNHSSPSYTSKQLLLDTLYEAGMVGDTISVDFDGVDDPGLTISPFGGRETREIVKHIDNILAFGDSSGNTYFWFVWGSDGSSDNLPVFSVAARDVSDYEYVLTPRDQGVVIDITPSGDRLKNYYSVKYEDGDGKDYYQTPIDDANLKDQDSIDADFRRDQVIDIGQGTSTLASQIGETQLAKFKDRRLKGKIEVSWWIRKKGGALVPACWAKAGERAYLPERDEIIFIGSTDYDAESGKLTITPDEPPDTLEALLARNELSYVE